MDLLVTGGAGFLGSTLVDRLLAEDHRVDVVDDLRTGALANLAAAREAARQGAGRLRIHQADVRDEALPVLLERIQPEVVVHLAGDTAKAGRSLHGQVARGTAGCVRVIEAAVECGVRRIVRVASARSQADPARGISDRALEEYLGAIAAPAGVAHTTLVLGTVYGPRQTPATESSVVAVLTARLLAERRCVLHGGGSATRDLLYVDDAIDALVRAVVDERTDDAIVEVGAGEQVAVATLVAELASILEVPATVAEAPSRPGEPGAVPVDPTGAAARFGWRPFTSRAEGLAATVSWWRDAPGRT